jgi:hypothetical protein
LLGKRSLKWFFVSLFVDFSLVISVLSLLSWNNKGSNPNIRPQLRNYWRVTFVVDYESTFFKCVMVTKFTKRMLRAMGRHIRIKRIIQEILYVENLVERRKYPIRINTYMI